MPRLTAAQREQLIPILVDAFPSRTQMEAVLSNLGVNFDALASTGTYATDLVYLLDAAQADSWTLRLLDALQRANPGNPALKSFLEPFDLSTEALAQEPRQIPLHYRRRAAEKTDTPPALPDSQSVPGPGPLPPGSRLPFNRNEIFTGRKQDLQQLAQHLLYGAGEAGREVGLVEALAATGMGGIGKTQLAVEFCYRYGRFTYGVHWIQANQDIPAEIAACGLSLGLQPWPDDLATQVRVTLQALSADLPRLVVLDNLEDPAVLKTWLPELNPARVLVTSRREKWPKGSGLRTQDVGVLSPPEGRALLCKLAERLEQVSEPELDTIGERLGWLPLALDLAGRYLADRPRLNPQGYLIELDEAGNALMQTSLKDWVAANPTGHSTDLAATFTLSWGELGEQERLPLDIFLACGWLAPNAPIPYALLEEADQAGFDRGLKRLYELGLLKSGDSGPVIHPLLAEFSRLVGASLPADSVFEKVTEAAIRQANRANNRGIPADFTPLRPHLEQLLAHLQSAPTGAAADLMNNLGFHLQMVGDYPAARPYYEQALAIKREALGETHPDTALSLNNLGTLLKAMGDLEGARPYYEQALAIRREALGDQHPYTATSLNNLGSLLQDMGDLEGARPYLEQALAIYQQALGDQHPYTAASLNNLGLLLQAMGDLAGARPYLEQALAIRREALGEKHPTTAASLNNLGALLRAKGDLEGARPYYEQALAINREALGEKHPTTATSLNNLGFLLQAMGDLAGARPYYEQALAIRREALGDKHPDTAQSLNNLGFLLQAMGDLAGARPYYEQALAISREALGEMHPATANTRINLIVLLMQSGENEAALAELLIIVEIAQQGELPESHPYVQFLAMLETQGEQDSEPDDM